MMTEDKLQLWAAEMNTLLTQISALDSGFDLEGNQIHAPAAALSDNIPAPMRSMYHVFNGLDIPDVYNGYFIDSAERVATAVERGMPTRIVGKPSRPIRVFGSDGGGGLFALDEDDGSVHYLQSDGVIEGGVFEESENVRARLVARHVADLLKLLLDDVGAFATGKEAHRYIID